jgi:aromatic-L-amino-acid/L-tryptophan decarboxylase
MTPDEFRRHGHAMIDLIADYRQNIVQRAIHPLTTPGQIKANLPANAPEKGEPFEHIMGDIEKLVMPGLFALAAP